MCYNQSLFEEKGRFNTGRKHRKAKEVFPSLALTRNLGELPVLLK